MQRNRISRIRTAGRSVPVSLSVLGHGSLSVSDLDRNRPDGNRDFFCSKLIFYSLLFVVPNCVNYQLFYGFCIILIIYFKARSMINFAWVGQITPKAFKTTDKSYFNGIFSKIFKCWRRFVKWVFILMSIEISKKKWSEWEKVVDQRQSRLQNIHRKNGKMKESLGTRMIKQNRKSILKPEVQLLKFLINNLFLN